MLVVVPNVMGMCLYSPPLDALGNSCRGVQFCEVSEIVVKLNQNNLLTISVHQINLFHLFRNW